MIANKAEFSAVDFKVIFKDEELVNFETFRSCRSVIVDSREVVPGSIFLALKGETIDAHKFVPNAIEAGAAAVVVEKSRYEEFKHNITTPCVVAEDTVKALGKLANYHRKRFSLPILTVGGSNGKTTTKEMITAVLKKKYNVLSTFENFNNQLGVPMMLLQLDDSYDLCVLEIGTNEPGEIFILSKMVEPTHGIITNIGKEHLEKLINIQGVETEETSMFAYLMKHDGLSLINCDDDRLEAYTKLINKKFTFGAANDLNLSGNIELTPLLNPIINFTYSGEKFTVNLNTIGYTTGLNAIAATACGLVFDVDIQDIKQALENFEMQIGHSYGRMKFESVSGISIINDCYNANPSSMRAALDTLQKIECKGKRIAVLGDMRELGDSAAHEHYETVKFALEVAQVVFVTGTEMEKVYELMNVSQFFKHYKDKIELVEQLFINLAEGDVVLVKGSRGMKMEEIVDNIKNNFEL